MRAVVVLFCSLFAAACVTTGTFNSKVAELDKRNADTEQKAKQDDEASKAKVADLGKKLADTQKQLADTQTQLADAQKKIADGEQKLAAANAERDDLSKKLDQSVRKLTGEKGELFQTLAKAKDQLEDLNKQKAGLKDQLDELNKQKAAAEARAATFQSLSKKLRAMTDTGQLKVQIRDGRMLIALPNDVLFESGKAALKAGGKDAIAKVAEALKSFTDRKFQVAGFTDNDPIHTARFPSNWELSAERALDVTRFMIEKGIQPQQLAAVGYGEFAPIVANDTDEHKAQNRRIEIALQPNLSELPPAEDLK